MSHADPMIESSSTPPRATARRIGPTHSTYLGLAVLAMALSLGLPARCRGQSIFPLRHAWETHPNLGNIWETNSDPRAPDIDVEQLDAPEAELRVRTAQRICLHHDRDGLTGKPRAVELILKRLAMDTEPLLVRRAMLAAAALIDDGSHAAELLAAAKDDSIMLETLDRALIRWKSPAARARWRSLIASHHDHPPGLSHALEGIRWVGDSQDIPGLVSILRSNDATDSERWLASLAIGELDRSGGLPLAQEILDSDIPNRFMLATNTIQYHTSNEACQLLLTVIGQPQREAVRYAATALTRQFPAKAVEQATTWISHREPTLRRLAAESLRTRPNIDSVTRVAPLLDDEDSGVRSAARQAFIAFAAAGLRTECDAAIQQLMDSDDHARAKEQSILWMVEVRSTDYFEQLIRCLDHTVPEVHMHAAWALMELVDDPKWVEEVAKRCQSMTEHLATTTKPATKSETIRGSFLLEVLGKNRHRPSLDMLRQYIPKNEFKMGNLTRTSAIWAIGQIQRDEDDPELCEQLMARMKDTPPMNPENYLVRFACILALGELGSADALPTLTSHGGDPPSPHGYATIWAKSQIEKKSK